MVTSENSQSKPSTLTAAALLVIAIATVSNLGYAVYRDLDAGMTRKMGDISRAAELTHEQAKRAWGRATVDIKDKLHERLREQAGRDDNWAYSRPNPAMLKSFSNSDVKWNGPKKMKKILRSKDT